MSSSRRQRYVAIFAFALVVAPLGCSLLAPSDEELMGGLSKESEAGSESGAGEGGNEAGERDVVCRPSNATCTVDVDCCSGRCRGNATCT